MCACVRAYAFNIFFIYIMKVSGYVMESKSLTAIILPIDT